MKTITYIYTASVIWVYFIGMYMLKYHKDRTEEMVSPYNPEFIFKVAAFVPVFNSFIILITAKDLVVWVAEYIQWYFGRNKEK